MDKKRYLDFEQPILELEERIQALRASAHEGGVESLMKEIEDVEAKLEVALRELSARLTPWQRTQLARHPMRPGAPDLAARLFTEILPLKGDRAFADDGAITASLARFNGRELMLIYQQKGREPAERVRHNFGMAHPEGFRKAIRVARLAERFKRPIILFIDTPGAYPGIGAEERGQAWAIAESIDVFLGIRSPTVAIVVGEGGSGGALALAVADRVLMMENAVYSVISPEGCASILFRDSSRAPEAAAALKITAPDVLSFRAIHGIIEEPPGGAHRNWDDAAVRVGRGIESALRELDEQSADERLAKRLEFFRGLGVVTEGES